ncbi:dehydrogenase/reductase SDR family member 4-like isoform X2 [Planococcus citri]|uniref:dehydrogenase/reductase SDR family member 4-like isoform X2 n=1 Tax=Planococcus citri TaxID=170843 RepID=UPI0031F92391
MKYYIFQIYFALRIGFAIANKLATEGAKVVISSRQEVNVNEAVEKLKNNGHQNNISGVVCHVGNKEDRKRLYEEALNKFGGIDILISNAAVNPFVGFTVDCPEDKWDKLFDTNVKSAFLLTKEVVPHLKERKGGSIINISSLAGLQPVPMHGPYCVSKTAILGLTRVFADELAQFNIRVNCIAPGLVRTKFAEHIYENKILHDAILSQIPMGRTGEPRDVEGIAAFLCSDDANYITGETIAVAGGMHTRL